MNVEHAFFTCLVMAILGFAAALINMATAAKSGFSSGSFTGVFIRHLLAAFFYVVGILGMIGFGIAWALQYLKH